MSIKSLSYSEKIDLFIKKLKKADITQTAAAEAVGITGAAISAVKRGKNKLSKETIKGLSDYFGLNPQYLENNTEEMFLDGYKQKLDSFKENIPQSSKESLQEENDNLKDEVIELQRFKINSLETENTELKNQLAEKDPQA